MPRVGARGQRRRIVAGIVTIGLVWPLAGLLPEAGASTSYSAIAAAEPFRVEVTSDILPLTTTYDVNASTAQALLDSFGQSRATAAAPYPGETITQLPGLLASIGLPFLPPYPLIVQTEAPTTTNDEISQGPLRLVATSVSDRSSALASVAGGPGIVSSTADSVVEATGDAAVRSTATTVTRGIEVADVLVLGRVDSTATAEFVDGDMVTSSTLTVSGLEVAGMSAELTEDGGLALAGQVLPGTAAPLEPILEAAGITMEFLPERTDEDGRGVLGAGLRITSVIEQGVPAPVTVVTILGRGRARVEASTLEFGLPDDLGQPPPISTTPVPDIPSAAVDTPTASAPATASTPVTPPAVGSLPPSTPPPDVAPPTATAAAPTATIGQRTFDLSVVYVLLLLGVVAVAATGPVFETVMRRLR